MAARPLFRQTLLVATWDAAYKRSLGTNLPIYHADAIGRPCLRCFPEARKAAEYKREVEHDG